MAKRLLELQKLMWQEMIARLTEDYEAGKISAHEYHQKVNDLLDDILEINKELKNLNLDNDGEEY